MNESRLARARETCPCCGYPTLTERSAYEICILCWWEDDGQDDPRADEVWGGPNHDLSLTEARRNFRDHLTMYNLGDDTRIGGPDSVAEVSAKREIVKAFDQLRADSLPEGVHRRLWEAILKNEAILEAELQRKIKEYEAQADESPSA
jgi:hypothetical protein